MIARCGRGTSAISASSTKIAMRDAATFDFANDKFALSYR